MTEITIVECPEYSCLTVKRVPAGSGHLICAKCSQPLWLLSPPERLQLNWIAAYDSVPADDEYIQATIESDEQGLGLKRGKQVLAVIIAHECGRIA